MLQFLAGHVRFCPAILGDDPFISERAIVDDGTNQFEVLIVTAADHEYSVSQLGISIRYRRVERGRLQSTKTPAPLKSHDGAAKLHMTARIRRWPLDSGSRVTRDGDRT